MSEAIVMNNFKTEDLDKKQHLRIAIFTASYAPFLDGISLSVQQRVRWLLQQGHEVFLIYPDINDKYPESIRNCTMPGLGELQSFPRYVCKGLKTNSIGLLEHRISLRCLQPLLAKRTAFSTHKTQQLQDYG